MITEWKSSSILEWTAISTLLMQVIAFSCCYYFISTEKLLSRQTTQCLRNTVKHTVVISPCHGYIWSCHTNLLLCVLHYIELIFLLKKTSRFHVDTPALCWILHMIMIWNTLLELYITLRCDIFMTNMRFMIQHYMRYQWFNTTTES